MKKIAVIFENGIGGQVLSFSLDWNCILAVENNESAAASVLTLVEAHRNGFAHVALLATSASENLRDKTFPGSYELFDRRVAKLGLADLPVLLTPGVFGLTYWDRSYYVDENTYEPQRDAIWNAIHPSVPLELELPPDDHQAQQELWAARQQKWRNAWCDVNSIITHIDQQRDVFVTSNTRDFQRNSSLLSSLGAAKIVVPDEAALLL